MSYKKIKTELQAKTELYNHYKELYEIGIQELKFERIQTDLIKESLEVGKSF